MKSTKLISNRYSRARKSTNLLNSSTYHQAHNSILTTGSNEKKKIEKISLKKGEKKRPKSQNLVTSVDDR